MKREQITIRLPDDLKEQIRQQADDIGIGISDLIKIILYQHFQNTAQE